MATPEIRQDPVTGRRVIIAPRRAARPQLIAAPNSLLSDEICPFCAGNEPLTPPEVWALRDPGSPANAPGWRVRIITNKYPALDKDAVEEELGDGVYRRTTALGAHEVIVESPDHAVHLSALDSGQFNNFLYAYRTRWRALAQERRWRHLMIYKNQGDRAGATLEHVHSQLTALPEVPPQAGDELSGASRHFAATGRCIYCEIIRRDLEHGDRLVAESERFVALCPFAPRFGFETWIVPRHHAAAFEEISDRDLSAFAETLRAIILKLNRLFVDVPFNYLLHSAPLGEPAAPHYHWHLEILPQLTRAAGFEWGSGMHMNSVAPEEAARLLRDAAV